MRGDPAVSGGEVARLTGRRGPGGCGVCQRGLGQKYMDMGTIEVALTWLTSQNGATEHSEYHLAQPTFPSTCRRTFAYLRQLTFRQAANWRLKIPHNGEFVQIVRSPRV